MDTPSSSKNSSLLVIAVGALAAIALLIGIIDLSKLSRLNDRVALVEALSTRVDTIEATSGSAKKSSDNALALISNVKATTERYLDTFSTDLASLRTQVNQNALDLKKVTETAPEGGSHSSHAAAAAGGSSGPTIPPGTLAEDGTYVIKSGDTFARLAAKFGIPVGEIVKANPDVNPSKLHVGQKVNVPKK